MTPREMEVLTTKEVAEILKVNTETILRLIWKKRFPGFFKVGQGWRIRRITFERYLERADNLRMAK